MNTMISNSNLSEAFFTEEGANATLPLVRLIVRDIVAAGREVVSQQARIESMASSRTLPSEPIDDDMDALTVMENRLHEEASKFEVLLQELNELGIELVDPTIGSVRFPTVIEGQVAAYTWTPNEDHVSLSDDIV